jgi:hypothetical protein
LSSSQHFLFCFRNKQLQIGSPRKERISEVHVLLNVECALRAVSMHSIGVGEVAARAWLFIFLILIAQGT